MAHDEAADPNAQRFIHVPAKTKEERTKLGDNRWRTRMRYLLTNASPKAVTVDLVQSGLWGDARITQESQKSQRLSADDARWRVPVPANGEATVTATFDTRY